MLFISLRSPETTHCRLKSSAFPLTATKSVIWSAQPWPQWHFHVETNPVHSQGFRPGFIFLHFPVTGSWSVCLCLHSHLTCQWPCWQWYKNSGQLQPAYSHFNGLLRFDPIHGFVLVELWSANLWPPTASGLACTWELLLAFFVGQFGGLQLYTYINKSLYFFAHGNRRYWIPRISYISTRCQSYSVWQILRTDL